MLAECLLFTYGVLKLFLMLTQESQHEANLLAPDDKKAELLKLVDELKHLYGISDRDIETYCGHFNHYLSMMRHGTYFPPPDTFDADIVLVRQLADEYTSERRMPRTVPSNGHEVREFLAYLREISGLTRKQIAAFAGMSLPAFDHLTRASRVRFCHIAALGQLRADVEAVHVRPEDRVREARDIMSHLRYDYGIPVEYIEVCIGRWRNYFCQLSFFGRSPSIRDVFQLRDFSADYDSGMRDPHSLPLDRDAFCQIIDYICDAYGLSYIDIAERMGINRINFMSLRKTSKRIPFSCVRAVERLLRELEDVGGVRVVEEMQVNDVVH